MLQMEHPKWNWSTFYKLDKGKLEDCTQKIKNDREKASVDLTKQDSTVTKFASVAQTEMETVWHTVEESLAYIASLAIRSRTYLVKREVIVPKMRIGAKLKSCRFHSRKSFPILFTEMKELFLDIPIPMNLLPDSEAGLAPVLRRCCRL